MVDDIGNVTKIFFNYETTQPKLDSVTCVLDEINYEEFKNNPPEGNTTNYFVRQPDGVTIKIDALVLRFLNEKVLTDDQFEITEETVKFPAISYLQSDFNDYSLPILGLTFRGYKVTYTQLGFDYLENKIYLIMKNIFENKNYAFIQWRSRTNSKPFY